jgi:hypothetical protein
MGQCQEFCSQEQQELVLETFGKMEIKDRHNDPQLSVKSHRTNPRDFDELSYIDEF